jgi:hypothetical protein
MFWCETGGGDTKDYEALAVVVSQLVARGVPASIDARGVPAGLNRNAQFDIAPYLRDGPPAEGDTVLLVAAHRVSDARLVALRRLAAGGAVGCLALGSFGSRQASIAARAKLAYFFGREPHVIDLGTGSGLVGDAPVFGAVRSGGGPATRPRLLLVGPDLKDRAQEAALIALGLSRQVRTAVLTDGRSKFAWIAARGTEIACHHYGELLPVSLAEHVDICVSFAPLDRNYRLQCLVANLALSGVALIDGTRERAIARENDAFLRGPVDLYGLEAFLTGEILPNLGAIGEHTRGSAFAARCAKEPVGVAWGEPEAPLRRSVRQASGNRPARIVMMPTNGVGLGHAQRCALVAAEFDRRRVETVFAAFPSCTRLIKSYGFDVMPLVPRSPLHAQKHENDLANYLRLRALSDGAKTLVFDGGFIFDSVYRTVLENRLDGVWIRRGLWQKSQDNTVALDREKGFARVIVPREAFDELNTPYSRGDHLRDVGPIVQDVGLSARRRRDLRGALAARYDRPFERLVVTQLGAGVAADRAAQIQAICGMMERRTGVLHLVVVWPTAALQPGWFGWSRSRVVKTQHAAVLAAAADLCISAAGYNSFHEAIYGALPTIFIPQTGVFMDDQKARARAARTRDLAGVVEPHELMALERMIGRFLDEGEAEAVRRRLSDLSLPERGNRAAAAVIEEITHGNGALEHDAVAHRPRGRR